MTKKFSFRKSKIEGTGVFAKVPIKKGDIITVFKGEKISIPELKRRYALGKERICDPLQISERQYLDLKKPYVYFNHSCEFNATLVGISTLIALKNISKGAEITYDYSKTEWTWERFGKNKEWEMECICGSKNCRKIIKQFPFLPVKLKELYLKNKTVQDFILRKANK